MAKGLRKPKTGNIRHSDRSRDGRGRVTGGKFIFPFMLECGSSPRIRKSDPPTAFPHIKPKVTEMCRDISKINDVEVVHISMNFIDVDLMPGKDWSRGNAKTDACQIIKKHFPDLAIAEG